MQVKNQAFLGGTAGNNNWREAFIEMMLARGVEPDQLFNPIVANWDAAAQAKEDLAKAESAFMLFHLTNPGTPGNEVSAYSIVEAVMGLYDDPDRTVVTLDTSELSPHVAKAMNKAIKDLRQRFPGGAIFDNLDMAADWLAQRLVK